MSLPTYRLLTRKSSKNPVRLLCGHDTLVTSAQFYSGSARCPQRCLLPGRSEQHHGVFAYIWRIKARLGVRCLHRQR